MDTANDLDQFELLEQKIDLRIERIGVLKRDNDALGEKVRTQEEKLTELNQNLQTLKDARDQARQRIVSLLEKIEHVSV